MDKEVHTSLIRKGARFVDQETGEMIEIIMLRKAKPEWFVVFLAQGVEKALKYEDFKFRFERYDPNKEKNTSLAS